MATAPPTSWGTGRATVAGKILAAMAWTGVSLVAAALAIVFAATLVAVAVLASGFLAVAAFALRSRRAKVSDPDLIEAHHVGGHSWVAYGWDGPS
jgi:glycerol-3-phosphate acyltransferase PlsY